MTQDSAGHVFVLQGKIGSVVSDMDVISTDSAFNVEPHWDSVLRIGSEAPREAMLASAMPAKWPKHGYGRSRADGTQWFIDVAANRYGTVMSRLRALLAEIGSSLPTKGNARKLPLVTMPLLGVGHGGWDGQSGLAINEQLRACWDFVRRAAVDVAIVTPNPAAYGALQHQRRAVGAAPEPVGASLGALARDGGLALFIGAGASIPSGLPSWEDLLAELQLAAERVRHPLTASELAGFANLDALDQAQLLHQVLGDGLGPNVVEVIRRRPHRPAVAHVLLASLGCHEAVTTNYDTLYEDAVRASTAEESRLTVVLPHELPVGRQRWLLKMHGSVEYPSSIVLSRSQFSGFDASSGPSGAVLQSLLLTRHLLVVGTSMKDPNVLRLIDGVERYRRSHTDASAGRHLGTILDVSGEPVRKRLHGDAFDWLDLPGEDTGSRARQLEILLDGVAMHAADDLTWLLDPRFRDLHPDRATRRLARHLSECSSTLGERGAGAGTAWAEVAAQLKAWGG